MVDLAKVFKKTGTLDFGGNPSLLVDLIHYFVKTSFLNALTECEC